MIPTLLATGWAPLVRYALVSTILLAGGTGGVILSRAPIQRVWLSAVTLAACLLAPGLMLVPSWPRWSVPGEPTPIARPEPPRLDPTRDAAVAWNEAGPPQHLVISREGGLQMPPPARASLPGPVRISVPERPIRRLDGVAWQAGVVAAYGCGALGWIMVWGLGQGVLVGLTRAARSASPGVIDRFRTIAEGRGDRVRLLVTDQVESPLTFTWLRPTILLPARLDRDPEGAELGFGLVHEWAHVEHRDYAGWTLAALAGCLLYPHPLFWFLRRQLRLNQDFLADDRAAATDSPTEFAAHLVAVARTRRRVAGRWSVPALGIQGRRSDLTRRVLALVAARPPHATRCRPGWVGLVLAAAALLLGSAVGLRLDAAPRGSDPTRPATSAQDPAGVIDVSGPKRAAPPGLVRIARSPQSWTGRVVEHGNRRPIAGANIRIRLVSDPQLPQVIRAAIETVTDATGAYRFELTFVEYTTPGLFLWFEVTEADHVAFVGQFRNPAVRHERDEEDERGYEQIDLWPARAVAGLVLTPAGVPAVGVRVTGCSTPGPRDPQPIGSDLTDTRTDAAGRFRVALHTQGQAVVRVSPVDAAPATLALAPDQRGDCGTIRLTPGTRVQGRVVNEAGQPLKGIYVVAGPVMGPVVHPMLDLAHDSYRTVTTQADGTFRFPPLPPGALTLEPNVGSFDLATRERGRPGPLQPLPAVFLSQTVTVGADQEPPPVLIPAIPAVKLTIQHQFVSGPTERGRYLWLSGQTPTGRWSASNVPTGENRGTMLAPRGLRDARLQVVSGEDQIVLHRTTPDGPLARGSTIALGTLDGDRPGIEVIHHQMPTLIIRVTDPAGQPIRRTWLTVEYDSFQEPTVGGLTGWELDKLVIPLQKPQGDGRYRTIGLEPYRNVEVNAAAEGFVTQHGMFRLAEGKVQEVPFVLQPRGPQRP